MSALQVPCPIDHTNLVCQLLLDPSGQLHVRQHLLRPARIHASRCDQVLTGIWSPREALQMILAEALQTHFVDQPISAAAADFQAKLLDSVLSRIDWLEVAAMLLGPDAKEAP